MKLNDFWIEMSNNLGHKHYLYLYSYLHLRNLWPCCVLAVRGGSRPPSYKFPIVPARSKPFTLPILFITSCLINQNAIKINDHSFCETVDVSFAADADGKGN
jgi:hypothetical protein